MKIMQLNVWMGHLLHPALKFIDQTQPDILTVQEVISSKHAHGLFDYYQTHERLVERFTHHFMAPTYSFIAMGEHCSYGNAIYSKYPLQDQSTTFTVGKYLPEVSIQNLKSFGEIRNIQTARVDDGRHPITIANHHGYHNTDANETGDSEKSMKVTAQVLKKIEGPLVLCGDFNASPDSKTIHQLDKLGLVNLSAKHQLTNTLSLAHRFDFKLVTDYIMVSPELYVKDFQAPSVVISDHIPLVMEF